MTTTQHTPGPWQLNGNGILLHPVTNAQLVTQRIETSMGSFEILDETNEPDANARLIAAVPDLLEALQECVQILAEHTQYDDDDGSAEGNARLLGLAAIAKANGEA